MKGKYLLVRSALCPTGEKMPGFAEYKSLEDVWDNYNDYAAENCLLIYTNILPLDFSEEQKKDLERLEGFNSINMGVIASPDETWKSVKYPRKDNLYFPANSVAFMAFNPLLLANSVFRKFASMSVSHAMFAALAMDMTFPFNYQQDKSIFASGYIDVLQKEYKTAARDFLSSGLKIHGYEVTTDGR